LTKDLKIYKSDEEIVELFLSDSILLFIVESINLSEVNNLLRNNPTLKVFINNLFEVIKQQNEILANVKENTCNYSNFLHQMVRIFFKLRKNNLMSKKPNSNLY
jgi:hypothetical protein